MDFSTRAAGDANGGGAAGKNQHSSEFGGEFCSRTRHSVGSVASASALLIVDGRRPT